MKLNTLDRPQGQQTSAEPDAHGSLWQAHPGVRRILARVKASESVAAVIAGHAYHVPEHWGVGR